MSSPGVKDSKEYLLNSERHERTSEGIVMHDRMLNREQNLIIMILIFNLLIIIGA